MDITKLPVDPRDDSTEASRARRRSALAICGEQKCCHTVFHHRMKYWRASDDGYDTWLVCERCGQREIWRH